MRANDLKARSIDLRTGLKYPPEPRGCLNSFALRLAATTGMIAVDAMTVIVTAADEIEAARPDARHTSRRLLHHRHPRDATDVNRIAGHFRRNSEKKMFRLQGLYRLHQLFSKPFSNLFFAGYNYKRKDIYG